VVFEVDHRAVPGAKLATSTIKLHGKPGTHFLTAYRDEAGRIAYLELTA